MLKIAAVGAGYWGKNLLRVFNEIGALYAICESNPESYGGLVRTLNYEARNDDRCAETLHGKARLR